MCTSLRRPPQQTAEHAGLELSNIDGMQNLCPPEQPAQHGGVQAARRAHSQKVGQEAAAELQADLHPADCGVNAEVPEGRVCPCAHSLRCRACGFEERVFNIQSLGHKGCTVDAEVSKHRVFTCMQGLISTRFFRDGSEKV